MSPHRAPALRRRDLNSRALAIALTLASALAVTSAAHAEPRVGIVDEGERVHGSLNVPLPGLAPRLRREALRGEHVAAQIVVEADRTLHDVELAVGDLVGPEGAKLRVEAFVEHYVDVKRRSRNARLADSLAFTSAARPSDRGQLGLVPDALVPVELARGWVGPLDAVPAAQRRAFWIEAYVPHGASSGRYVLEAELRSQGRPLGHTTLELEVLPHALPYQATRFFAYYEPATLERRFSHVDAVEKQLWQLLHAHHLDAVTMLLEPAQVERIAGALDGSWFRPAEGYFGPGEGEAPFVVFYGAYGLLGEPSASALARLEALSSAARRHHPGGMRLVYAVDEDCASPWGPAWRRLLDERPELDVRVVHTCHEDPNAQDVDVVMQPGQAFRREPAALARAAGKHVFVYNGQLPYAPPLMLDVPATALTLSGWIAAAYDVERWFLWETTFWDDGNRGGRGPRDVFVDPETFHNADGDVALLDGLLVYPGRGHAPGESSLDVDAVLPSLRLKRLRRGIEDAGLLAIASHRLGASEVARVVRELVPAAFDELGPRDAASFELDPRRHARLRETLRRAATHASGRRGEIDEGLVQLRRAVALSPGRARPSAARRAGVQIALPVGLFALGLLVARRATRDGSRGR